MEDHITDAKARAILAQSAERQKHIALVVMGDPNWEPTEEQLAEVKDMFLTADVK